MTDITTTTETLTAGDYVESDAGEDADFGTVLSVHTDGTVTIAWDGSAARSTQAAEGLTRISAERYRALRAAM